MDRFITISVSDIIDDLCGAVDAPRAKAAGDARWLNAIDAAWGYILQDEALRYEPATHTLQVASASEAGKVYAANGACQCAAFARGGACWHRAAARLVRRAMEARDLAEASEAAALGARLARARARYLVL